MRKLWGKVEFNINALTITLFSLLLPGMISGQEFKTVGYFPTYRFSRINDVDFDKLTHVNIAFANPNGVGELTTDGRVITPVVQKAHAAGLEVYIALAGGASPLSVWEDWITPGARSNFISGIVEYVHQHDLQGVDVDLEWGTVNDDYSGFVLELKDSLDVYNLGLSAALPGIYRYPEISNEAMDAFDWINIMVYDLTGPWAPNNPGPHSPYSFAERSINYWTNQGLEKERMVLGMPFYGYDFTDPGNVRALTYNQMVNRDTSYARLDQVGQIYYNGIPTIIRKTQLALDDNLDGVMIWEVGQDHFGEFSLLEAIASTIEASNTTPIVEVEHTPRIDYPYPNPVSDLVNVKFHEGGKVKLTLYSRMGGKMVSQDFFHQGHISFDMSNYPGGAYFVMLETEEAVETFRVIKY